MLHLAQIGQNEIFRAMSNYVGMSLSALCALQCLFLPFEISAQNNCNSTLYGKVIDEHNNQPLPYSAILIKDLNKGVNSDEQGNYILEGLCPGSYTVTCSHIGCEDISLDIQLAGSLELNFELEHHAEILDRIDIVGTRLEQQFSQQKNSLSLEDKERTKGQSLAASLQSISGVTLLSTGPTIGKPVVHGLHSNRVVILNNGIRQEDQQWGSEHAPNIDPFLADDLSVVKGAGAVQYGSDAVGGVVIVQPPKLPTSDSLSGKVGLIGQTNGLGGTLSGQLQGGLGKVPGFGWRVQGTVKRAGDTRTPDYVLSNTGMREFNFSTAVGIARDRYGINAFYSRFETGLGILRSAHIGNLTDLELAIASPQPIFIEDFTFDINNPRQQITHQLAKVESYFKINDFGKLSIQYGLQLNRRQEFDVRRGGRDTIPALDLDLTTNSLDVVFEHRSFGKVKGKFGITGNAQNNINVPGTGVLPLIPNYDQYSGGFFWIERLILDRWQVEAGVRYDFRHMLVKTFDRQGELIKPEFNFHNYALTLGAIFRPNEKLSLRSNIGTAFRPPNVSELFSQGLHQSTASIEIGDTSLVVEKSLKWVTSFSYSHKRLQVELTSHVNHISDYIYLEPQGDFELTIRGAFPVFRYVQTDALILGFDAKAQYEIYRNVWALANISIIRGTDIRNDIDLIFMPANRYETGLAYRTPKAGPFANFHVKLAGEYVAQQNKVPENVDFQTPPDAYFLLNADVGGTIKFSGSDLTLGLAGENLLNTSYRDYLNRFRYYADDLGLNIRFRATINF